MKTKKEFSFENVFSHRENGKWVAGIYHAGRTVEPIFDKKQEIALAKLCNILYLKLEETIK